MVSKSDLLEKRLRSRGGSSSPVKEVRRPEELSLFSAVNFVHHLSNELWNDVQIFGPHQQQQQSPHKPTVFSPEAKENQRKSPTKRASRSDELFAELDEERKSRLDEIAATYSESLNKNLCTSLLDEVQLWFQLLTENYDSSMSSFAPQDHLLSTVSARAYFVKNVLELQMTAVIMYLDPQVCQMLLRSYPHRIPKHVRKQLETLVSMQLENQQKITQMLSGGGPNRDLQSHDRVTFQHETDGRSNFLNQNDFHSFCKQRDLFYAIKDLWTSNNKTPTSNKFANSAFSSPATPGSPSITSGNRSTTPRRTTPIQQTESGAYSKMRQMMQLTSSPTNLIHLAALVLSQYLLDYSHFGDYGDIAMEDENIRQIFQSNPSKFKQLENRFPNSMSNRTDPLQFFHYFLQLASWPDFNQHLLDRCVLELEEIESSLERQEARTSKEIVDNLKRARIVAQLLGYLHFRPYQRTSQQLSNCKSIRSIEFETLLQRQIRLRNYQRPPVDLRNKIYAALTTRKLIFTLTWILEYFIQADPVSFHLPAYKEALQVVAQVYRTMLTPPSSTSPLSRSNQAFLRFYCGNLFRRPDFPSTIILMEEFPNDPQLTEYLHRGSTITGGGSDEDDLVLDSCSIIGDVLNGIFFEKQMTSFKSLLSSNTSPWKRTSAPSTPVSVLPVKRNIRPVPVNQNSPTKTIRDLSDTDPETAFQLQLEASFFQSHPASMKRSVEFVAERIASNYVRTLRSTLYPQFRDECFVKGIHGEEAVAPFQQKILTDFKQVCFPKVDQVVDLLLGGDALSEGALSACKKIVARRSLERVKEWTDSHINTDLFPQGKSAEFPLKPQPVISAASYSSEISSAKFHALVKLQQTLQKIYKSKLRDAELAEFLSLLNAESLGKTTLVVNATVDVILALFTFCPNLIPTKMEDKFIEFWKLTWKPSIKILCPRNILLFEQSKDPRTTWNRVTLLVKRLIKLSLMDLKDVEGVCLGFLRHEWPPEVLRRVSEFSRNISGGAPVRTEESEVIDWIAWACSDEAGF